MKPNAKRFNAKTKSRMGLVNKRLSFAERQREKATTKRTVLIGRLDGLEAVEIKR